MKLKAIPYQSGYLFVDDSVDVVKGDLHLYRGEPRVYPHDSGWYDKNKIIAQYNLNLEGIPYVELEEDDVKIISDAIWGEGVENEKREWYELGYNAAQPKKYTEDDLAKAYEAGESKIEHMHHNSIDYLTFDEFIETLRPKIESIEVETKEIEYGHVDDYSKPHGFKQDTITYQKNGATYLKLEKINYDTNSRRIFKIKKTIDSIRN